MHSSERLSLLGTDTAPATPTAPATAAPERRRHAAAAALAACLVGIAGLVTLSSSRRSSARWTHALPSHAHEHTQHLAIVCWVVGEYARSDLVLGLVQSLRRHAPLSPVFLITDLAEKYASRWTAMSSKR